MKKKIKDLSDDEIENICSSYTFHSKRCFPFKWCIHYCPFYISEKVCIKDFIKELKTKEVELMNGEPIYIEKGEENEKEN